MYSLDGFRVAGGEGSRGLTSGKPGLTEVKEPGVDLPEVHVCSARLGPAHAGLLA